MLFYSFPYGDAESMLYVYFVLSLPVCYFHFHLPPLLRSLKFCGHLLVSQISGLSPLTSAPAPAPDPIGSKLTPNVTREGEGDITKASGPTGLELGHSSFQSKLRPSVSSKCAKRGSKVNAPTLANPHPALIFWKETVVSTLNQSQWFAT